MRARTVNGPWDASPAGVLRGQRQRDAGPYLIALTRFREGGPMPRVNSTAESVRSVLIMHCVAPYGSII